MDRQEARLWVRQQLESYLTGRGLNPRQPFHCLNPAHDDRRPSMSFDRKRHKVHCFACGADYDIFDLIGLEYGLSEPGAFFQKAYELYGLKVDKTASPAALAPSRPEKPERDYTAYFKRCQKRLNQTDYHLLRGISETTAQRFGLGFDPNFKAGGGASWAALIIPTGPHSFTARNTDPKAPKDQRVRKRGGAPLYNAGVLETDLRPVFVVEGEFDALALAEVGAEALALGSTSGLNSFLRLLAARPPRSPLLLALDHDPAGQEASRKLQDGLNKLGCPWVALEPFLGLKDAAEALKTDVAAFTDSVRAAENMEELIRQTEREAYLATSVAHYLADFKNGQNAWSGGEPWPTGLSGLDAQLEGGFYEGLYILGGISSLGKTSLALQLADQVAASGREVLIFSLEMARSELMAKSLSRLTLLISLETEGGGRQALSARSLTTRSRLKALSPKEARLIGQAVDRYGQFAHSVFINEGLGDLGAAEVRLEVDRHWRHTGRRPMVIVDYLQILAPRSDRATDKQKIDQAVLELKRISRDFKVPLIALSSFNRAGYREAVTMEAFKESGAIEYSSDVLLGLQLKGAGERDFDLLAAKERNPRQVELVILKNRHGPAGRKVALEYYPQFNYFRELAD